MAELSASEVSVPDRDAQFFQWRLRVEEARTRTLLPETGFDAATSSSSAKANKDGAPRHQPARRERVTVSRFMMRIAETIFGGHVHRVCFLHDYIASHLVKAKMDPEALWSDANDAEPLVDATAALCLSLEKTLEELHHSGDPATAPTEAVQAFMAFGGSIDTTGEVEVGALQSSLSRHFGVELSSALNARDVRHAFSGQDKRMMKFPQFEALFHAEAAGDHKTDAHDAAADDAGSPTAADDKQRDAAQKAHDGSSSKKRFGNPFSVMSHLLASTAEATALSKQFGSPKTNKSADGSSPASSQRSDAVNLYSNHKLQLEHALREIESHPPDRSVKLRSLRREESRAKKAAATRWQRTLAPEWADKVLSDMSVRSQVAMYHAMGRLPPPELLPLRHQPARAAPRCKPVNHAKQKNRLPYHSHSAPRSRFSTARDPCWDPAAATGESQVMAKWTTCKREGRLHKSRLLLPVVEDGPPDRAERLHFYLFAPSHLRLYQPA
ncbi:hypothetical protein DIPPA_05619 [Diplonema papillatum]|nr:hypothetical protein DIPPA_05619 [Diplonema papillatum]|eukprot:gene17594-27083_t